MFGRRRVQTRGLDVVHDEPARGADVIAAEWDRPVPTPAELEREAVAGDLAARERLADVLAPFDRDHRREILTWALRQLVDAPTVPVTTRKAPDPADVELVDYGPHPHGLGDVVSVGQAVTVDWGFGPEVTQPIVAKPDPRKAPDECAACGASDRTLSVERVTRGAVTGEVWVCGPCAIRHAPKDPR